VFVNVDISFVSGCTPKINWRLGCGLNDFFLLFRQCVYKWALVVAQSNFLNEQFSAERIFMSTNKNICIKFHIRFNPFICMSAWDSGPGGEKVGRISLYS